MSARATAPRGVPLRAVLLVYGYRAASGLVVGYPVARALGALGPSASPDGDRLLFRPGAVHLVEALRFGARALPAAIEGAALSALVVSLLAVVPLAIALADLWDPGPPRERVVARGIAAVPRLLGLAGITLVAQAGTALLAAMTTTAVGKLSHALANERTADLIPLPVALGGLGGVFLLGVVQDVARTRIIAEDVRILPAIRRAAGMVATFPRSMGAAFVPPALGAVVLVAAASTLTTASNVAGPGKGRVLLVLVLHQLAIAGVVFLRLRAFAQVMDLGGRDR